MRGPAATWWPDTTILLFRPSPWAATQPRASIAACRATEGDGHGRHPQQLRRDPVAEPVLAGLGTPDRQGIQRRPRLQGRLGRRGVEDAGPRPAHRQRQRPALRRGVRSEEHTSELQSLMRISYAVFCLKKKKQRDI